MMAKKSRKRKAEGLVNGTLHAEEEEENKKKKNRQKREGHEEIKRSELKKQRKREGKNSEMVSTMALDFDQVGSTFVEQVDRHVKERTEGYGDVKRAKKKKNESEADCQHSEEGKLPGKVEDEYKRMEKKDHPPEEKEKKRKKKKREKEVQHSVEQSAQRGTDGNVKEQDKRMEEKDHHLEKREKKRKKKKRDKEVLHSEEESAQTGTYGNVEEGEEEEEEEKRKTKKKKKRGKEEGIVELSPAELWQKSKIPLDQNNTTTKYRRKEKLLHARDGKGNEEDTQSHTAHRNECTASETTIQFMKAARNESDCGGTHELHDQESRDMKEPSIDPIGNVGTKIIDNNSSHAERPQDKKGKRRKSVTFQDQENQIREALKNRRLPSGENSMENIEEIWGIRFSREEDEILQDAVWKYIKSKGWDEEEGLKKVLDSKTHSDARNCWADIKLCLPHRPRQAIRYRAHLLLQPGSSSGRWSKEDEDLLWRLHQEHGCKWKEFSPLLNRNRANIKEKWRCLKRTNAKGVHGWKQAELQQLSDMVHECLRINKLLAAVEKKPDRHILRDDICWEKIADTIGTHHHGTCCSKWYYNLQSSLGVDGLWDNIDDFLLLKSLLESGACAEEEVEWDSLLDHRSGHVCSTRWKQMVKHLGENRSRPFSSKLDILARRYAPELLESTTTENHSIRSESDQHTIA